jgi:hypothetical protein
MPAFTDRRTSHFSDLSPPERSGAFSLTGVWVTDMARVALYTSLTALEFHCPRDHRTKWIMCQRATASTRRLAPISFVARSTRTYFPLDVSVLRPLDCTRRGLVRQHIHNTADVPKPTQEAKSLIVQLCEERYRCRTASKSYCTDPLTSKASDRLVGWCQWFF